MRRLNWRTVLGISLVGFSGLAYLAHFALFRDAHHIFIYLVGDVAFVPIEVLLVTLILHELLSRREKKSRLNKLNMVVGTFFSEVGTELLRLFAEFDDESAQLRARLQVQPDWPDREFGRLSRQLAGHPHAVDSRRADLEALRRFLHEKRDFLLRLLENPNLLEHESLTDLLWAVFHLTEELDARGELRGLPDTDYDHLSGDIRRAQQLLVGRWLAYMRHLKADYPYLFSLAARTNPFDPAASAVVAQAGA